MRGAQKKLAGASAPWNRRRPKRAALFLFLSIHIIDIVGYSKQVTLYYTHLAGVVTGEAFLFLARKRNGSNTLLCNNKFFYMGSYT